MSDTDAKKNIVIVGKTSATHPHHRSRHSLTPLAQAAASLAVPLLIISHGIRPLIPESTPLPSSKHPKSLAAHQARQEDFLASGLIQTT